MRTQKTLTIVLSVLSLLLATSALARPVTPRANTKAKYDGRWARPHVVKYNQARGRSTEVRVHHVRNSRSGKSSQVLVQNRNSGKVKAYNVHHRTGKVSATRTGLLKQNTARVKAHNKLRRERAPHKGSFSGVHNSGLSKSGKSYKFTSKTDPNEKGYVKVTGGPVKRYDNGKRAATNTTKAPARTTRPASSPATQFGADQLK